MTPTGAQTVIDGSFYKIGIHGLVFIWNGEQWVKSTRPKPEVLRNIADFGIPQPSEIQTDHTPLRKL